MLAAVKDTKTQPVIRFMKEVISQFGVPRRIISDRGSCYTSNMFRKFCKENGIIHVQNAVSTPRANGQVERYNSTILSSLATTAEEDDKWDRDIKRIQFAINTSVHSVTNKSPFELLYGYQPRSPIDAFLANEVSIPQESRNVEDERKSAMKKIEESQRKQKVRFDSRRSKTKRYAVGDLVLVRKQSFGDGQSRKLLPKYKGPFRIIKQLPNDRFVVKELTGSGRSQRAGFENVESVEHLKRWIPPGGKSDSDDDDYGDEGR